LGFTLTARGQHPFGTGNTIIQLQGNYLELLSVTVPQDVPEHTADRFSFATFNRDYLARHEGFSMVVFDTPDARADVLAWRKAGLHTYEAVDFSRMAKLPNGDEMRVAFSLAFVRNPAAPWLAPSHVNITRPATTHNRNSRSTRMMLLRSERCGSSAMPRKPGRLLSSLDGIQNVQDEDGRSTLKTSTGDLVLATPHAFVDVFGVAPPNATDAPCLVGLVVGCRSLEAFRSAGLAKAGDLYVVPPERLFGAALAFAE
jgi:hypothetical protein